VAMITTVENLKGDASAAICGNKKRYIFDFHCSLNFEIRDDEVDEVVASGTLELPDVNSASHEETEVHMSWKQIPSNDYKENANKCREELVASARSSVIYFVHDFNEHY